MKQTKVLAIFTGGTIGSAPSNGFLSPGGEAPRKLLIDYFSKEKQAVYEERFGTEIVFETVCPYEILSENLNGKHLEFLWKTVKEAAGYDGMIIMVGTDTLAYSSAALGYLFANTRIPIVTVSANAPLTDESGNGFDNFEGAMALILEGKHKGVFCSYKNEEAHFIHYATRLLPQVNYSDRVVSVKDCFYAKVESDSQGLKFVVEGENKEGLWEEERSDFSTALFNLDCTGLADIHISFQRPYPGMEFVVPGDCNAVLLDTYHSGTLPVEDSGFHQLALKAKEKNIPVFVAGVPEGLTYETVREYQKENLYILPQASPAAMYVKLWLLLVNGLKPEEYVGISMGNDIV